MNYRDRGSIKWSSLMLPEHKERLSAWYKEQEYVAKPELDEQKWEEINRLLAEAWAENQKIEVTYYHDHRLHTAVGRIKTCDPIRHYLQLTEESILSISMTDIIDVRLA